MILPQLPGALDAWSHSGVSTIRCRHCELRGWAGLPPPPEEEPAPRCLPGRQLSVAPRHLSLLMSVTDTCLGDLSYVLPKNQNFFLCFSTICLGLFWAFQNYFNIYMTLMSKLNRSPPSQHIVCTCPSTAWCCDICVPCVCYSLCLSLHFLVVGHPCVPYVWYSCVHCWRLQIEAAYNYHKPWSLPWCCLHTVFYRDLCVSKRWFSLSI